MSCFGVSWPAQETVQLLGYEIESLSCFFCTNKNGGEYRKLSRRGQSTLDFLFSIAHFFLILFCGAAVREAQFLKPVIC